MKIKLLDDGFVQLVDHVTSEDQLVRYTRISREDGKQKRDTRRFITYLVREGHHTPLEMIKLVYRVRLPIYIDRHLVRYRANVRVERSMRYNKRPLGAYSVDNMAISLLQKECIDMYNLLIDGGMAAEDARSVLPLGLYTEYYVEVNMRSLLNMMKQRLCDESQAETSMYVQAMSDLASMHYPSCVSAINRFILKNK